MVSSQPIRTGMALTTSHFRRLRHRLHRPAGPAPLICGLHTPSLADGHDGTRAARRRPWRGHVAGTRPRLVNIAGPPPCHRPSAPASRRRLRRLQPRALRRGAHLPTASRSDPGRRSRRGLSRREHPTSRVAPQPRVGEPRRLIQALSGPSSAHWSRIAPRTRGVPRDRAAAGPIQGGLDTPRGTRNGSNLGRCAQTHTTGCTRCVACSRCCVLSVSRAGH